MNLIKLVKSAIPKIIKKNILRYIYWSRARKFSGSKYYCPVCKYQLNSFTSLSSLCNGKFVADVNINGEMHKVDGYETFNVENFICPVCSAQDKARLYAIYLNKKLCESESHERIKLVHFAPEAGLHQFLKWDQRINYRSADLLREEVDDRVDITNMLIYPDESLDAFICSHILEHIPDDKRALSELYRTLKVGGWGIIMAPILLTIEHTYDDSEKVTEEERLLHFGLEDHIRIYSKNDFIDLLAGSGFIVRQLGQNYFGKDIFHKIGLSDTSILYVVEKK
jgi:hypothetical protein